ncbi:MAG: hypothetical protein NTW87_25305, partial [Planctomycetota bacterium]|nr:hypothetical protein [Planctomycetota bacterium]
RGDAAALPAVLAAVEDKDPALRLAALTALAGVGDASAVPLVISKATTGQGAERSAAQACLRRMAAKGVDEALLAALKNAEPATRAELIGLLAARAARVAVPALMDAASDADGSVRTAALGALRTLATADDLLGLVRLLSKVQADADRASLEPVILSFCRGSKEREKQGEPLIAALPDASVPARASLLRMLGRLGGAKALEAVRADLKHADETVRDAALRALADWPDGAPAPDVLAIAANKDETLPHHVLALRGYVRMITLPGTRSRTEMAALLPEAGKVARRDEEKQIVLAAIEKTQWAANLALSGTASSPDGLECDGGATGDQAAIDGDASTYWDEVDDQKLYILQVDWPNPVTFTVIRIMGYEQQGFAPKDFDVLCDGKVVKEARGAAYTNNLLLLDLPKTTCGKLQLKITGYYGKSPAIRELEVFDEGKLPPPPVIPKK